MEPANCPFSESATGKLRSLLEWLHPELHLPFLRMGLLWEKQDVEMDHLLLESMLTTFANSPRETNMDKMLAMCIHHMNAAVMHDPRKAELKRKVLQHAGVLQHVCRHLEFEQLFRQLAELEGRMAPATSKPVRDEGLDDLRQGMRMAHKAFADIAGIVEAVGMSVKELPGIARLWQTCAKDVRCRWDDFATRRGWFMQRLLGRFCTVSVLVLEAMDPEPSWMEHQHLLDFHVAMTENVAHIHEQHEFAAASMERVLAAATEGDDGTGIARPHTSALIEGSAEMQKLWWECSQHVHEQHATQPLDPCARDHALCELVHGLLRDFLPQGPKDLAPQCICETCVEFFDGRMW